MKVDLIRYTPAPAEVCGEAAAICTAYADHTKALRGALSSGHESVIEHATFTFRVEGVSRVLLAQITRHRLASFSVESQRYVQMDDMPVIIPPSIHRNALLMQSFAKLIGNIKEFYEDAVALGIPLEDARYITPQAAATKIILTMNARELLHFFKLRCCNRAQWEIRELADNMLMLCRVAAPQLFKRAGCACMRDLPCPEGKRSCGRPRAPEKAR